MGTMPIGLMGGMGGAQDDPLYNMSDTDYVGTMIAAQKKRDEEDERRKKEEEFKRQIMAQQQARQQQMAPLERPLQQMIDEREQREGVGTARGTIIEMLRAIAQNKNYKPITDKIREEETKRHTANMAQLKAMDLEDKLSQKDIELQMKNQQFGQMMAQKQAESANKLKIAQEFNQWRYYNSDLQKKIAEGKALTEKEKLHVMELKNKWGPYNFAAMMAGAYDQSTGDIKQDPDSLLKTSQMYITLNDKSGGREQRPQVVGRQSTTDANGNVNSTNIFGYPGGTPQDKLANRLGMVNRIMGGQQQPQENVLTSTNPWNALGKQQQSDPQAATVTSPSGKKVANPLAVISLEQSQIPAAKNMGEFMRLRPHLIQFGKARFLPNGYVDQSTVGTGEGMNRKAEVNDYRKNLSDADSFSGNFGQVMDQAGQMYLKGMDKMMLTSESKNLLTNAAVSWLNGRAQRLLKLGLKDTAYSDFINLRDANLQTLQEKLTAVGGKTLTDSEQRIVKDYWPQTEFSDAENMLNSYARFNMLNKLKVYRMKHNMLSSGTEFLSGQILDKDGKVIGDSISNYVDKSVKEIKALKDAGKIDAARKKIADLMNADEYFDTKMDQELHRDKYQKRRVRI